MVESPRRFSLMNLPVQVLLLLPLLLCFCPALSAPTCDFSCPSTDQHGHVLIKVPGATPYSSPYSVFDCVCADCVLSIHHFLFSNMLFRLDTPLHGRQLSHRNVATTRCECRCFILEIKLTSVGTPHQTSGLHAIGSVESSCPPRALPCSDMDDAKFSAEEKSEIPVWVERGGVTLWYIEHWH